MCYYIFRSEDYPWRGVHLSNKPIIDIALTKTNPTEYKYVHDEVTYTHV